jgi:hypothetical protein
VGVLRIAYCVLRIAYCVLRITTRPYADTLIRPHVHTSTRTRPHAASACSIGGAPLSFEVSEF